MAFSDTGFSTEPVATLAPFTPVGIAFAPDGRLFILQKAGIVRIFEQGALLPAPFLDISSQVAICDSRGLTGLAFDANFATNGHIYILYAVKDGPDCGVGKARLSRITADPDSPNLMLQGSEVTILEMPSLTEYHTSGTVRVAPDGKLFVGMGDGATPGFADFPALEVQNLNSYAGKILRLNVDGSAPSDNPFYEGTQSIRSHVWAYGLRNPFRFALHPLTGEPYIGDVGWNTSEEINTGRGANFGWPCYEGNLPQPEYQSAFPECRALAASAVKAPLYTYPRTDGISVTGGTFYSDIRYPEQYRGNLFFGDYGNHWIKRMIFDDDGHMVSVQPFATNLTAPVDIAQGPDGLLYYASFSTGVIGRIRYTGDNLPPVPHMSATPSSGYSPLQVAFSSAGSSDPEGGALTYAWDFGDGETSTDPNPVHIYSLGVASVVASLTISDTEGLTSTLQRTITIGSLPPQLSITSPGNGDVVLPGQIINFAGTAFDPDETISPSQMQWSVLLYHNDHVHDGIATTGLGGSFEIEDHGSGSGNYGYEIILAVTDSRGLTSRTSVRINVQASATSHHAKWVLRSVDSEERRCDDGAATISFDDDPATFWITEWCNGSPPPPHTIEIDLGEMLSINAFRYLPRQDGCANGWIKDFQLYVSTDLQQWDLASSGAFSYPGATINCPGSVPPEQEVPIDPIAGRYVRLVALSEIRGNPWTAVAEFDIIGVPFGGNIPPNGTISQPSSDTTISLGGTVNFAASATDADQDLPLTYSWNFGAQSGVPGSTELNPGVIQFNALGTHTVTFTVTDSLGASDPTPPTRTVTVVNALSAVIPNTGWSLKAVDSQETVGENGAATNAFDSSATTKWVTKWMNGVAPMPHFIEIDMGQHWNLDSFRYLPRQDGCSNGWIKDYEFYVSSDGVNWILVSQGAFNYEGAAFLCPGSPQVTERMIPFASTSGRFFRLRALSEVRGFPYTTVANLRVTGTAATGGGNLPPDSSITFPSGNLTINTGQSVSFSGSGTDPDGDLDLSYSWSFGAAGTSTLQNPTIQFSNPGTYNVTFTVSDSLGAPDPTPATRTITVVNPGSSVLPRTGWSVKAVDSQETVGENGAATNAIDGSNTSKWVTKWLNGVAQLPHFIDIDMGQHYDLDGFRYLPRQDGCASGWIKNYEFLVSSDGTNWTPVAQGTFDYGSAALTCPGAPQISARIVSFAPITARYFRLRAL
ncbi:MAG: discoidin domain-containing protein, partial [Candidatus Korobacteraceae bacterium]